MTWYRYVGYKPLRGTSASCGDFEIEEHPKRSDILYAMPDVMSGSDYSGSSCEYSNYRVFLQQFGKIKGVYDIYGGYGTYGIAIRKSVLDSNKDIQDVLKGLEEYPIIDEQDQSQLEMDWAGEAWTSWVRDDAVRLLREDWEDWEPSDEDTFQSQFNSALNEANEDWESENRGMTVRIERVLPYLKDIILVQETSRENLGELAARKWVSEASVIEFNARLALREIPQIELPLLLDKDWKYASVQRDFEDRCKNPDHQLSLSLQVPFFQAVTTKG